VSRAFVKEDNAEPPLVVPRAPLPPDVPNYVTRRGLALLQRERSRLESARPVVDAESGAAAMASHKARLGALELRIASAISVDPASLPHDEVRFSALVTLRDDAGHERRYRIVGVDEADPVAGRIAFVAPLARALTGTRLGDSVALRQQGSSTDFEIVAIDYAEEAPPVP
jgi:transcription elongation factor GreB